ncbi:DNA-3-methyladenine glycosylase I [Quadrisphaera granulorum]|uniref:DNA-3-methyladenine glycosylase I n=1 Tax=Quadrisphaera granulorum TaxID=317664 RepID=A0A316A4P8_9ACTN|nr:DNA-3-methyladenine glycosylase I [Quadrisphaera granulorum]PWJ52896.1 DNA-3-methyladenine glycosylase I [Quadrisphaera granulorum]SZE97278.1 DNA-3-methyladenine glycosylase I [Quadrisphaera granulorum]
MDVVIGADGRPRCAWGTSTPDYIAYHDTEWGFPVSDDRRLFEKVCLEGFQSGLSWLTILRKREGFRAAFADFDHEVVAEFDERDVERLLADVGIVRHRGKIEATLNNAARARELVAEYGSIAAYMWSWEPADRAVRPFEVRATSPESTAMSKDLKKRGWRFVGPTTAYAFHQAMGLVNDHAPGCAAREEVAAARAAFTPPVSLAVG